MSNAFQALEAYIDSGLEVHIYSSRTRQEGGRAAMKAWFIKHGFDRVEELFFPEQKPAAFLTIDDRAMCFMGVFPSPQEVHNFKTWQQQEV